MPQVFTGIVQETGTVTAVENAAHGVVLWIDPAGWSHRPSPGDSVAVNGCCLTVTAPETEPAPAPAPARDGHLRFDVVPQTLCLTVLGDLKPGDRVNLESAVTPATLLSGHIVQGHIDGIGTVREVTGGRDGRRIRVEPPRALLPYIVAQGSVAIDGVSLTVAALDEAGFEVALIPTTMQRTTLGEYAPGRRVNLETDYLVKAVARLMGTTGGG